LYGRERIIKVAWLQIWGLIEMGNYRSVSLGLRQVIASARGLISDEGHLDPDLVYYLQQVINAVEDFNPDDKQNNWEAFCDHLENRHLRSSFFKLRQVPSGLYILTIHQSKGREFDHVIIPWLSGEGEPQKSKTGGRYYSKLDFCKLEDRKLMYVALTRARKRVTIFFPEEDPSPFLRNWKLI
jgi:superfamily I DNA/RNA helicase